MKFNSSIPFCFVVSFTSTFKLKVRLEFTGWFYLKIYILIEETGLISLLLDEKVLDVVRKVNVLIKSQISTNSSTNSII